MGLEGPRWSPLCVWSLALAALWGMLVFFHRGSCPPLGQIAFHIWRFQDGISKEQRWAARSLDAQDLEVIVIIFNWSEIKFQPTRVQGVRKQTPPLAGICCREFTQPKPSSLPFPHSSPYTSFSSLNASCLPALGLKTCICLYLEYSFLPIFFPANSYTFSRFQLHCHLIRVPFFAHILDLGKYHFSSVILIVPFAFLVIVALIIPL